MEIVRRGGLLKAIRALALPRSKGPWGVLCDNESFLRHAASQAAYRKVNVSLWDMPARSPDLNPVEKFWSWLRRSLRRMDLEDLKAKRKPLDKAAYTARVQAVCRTQKAQRAGAACCQGLKKVCKEVVKKRGAMARS